MPDRAPLHARLVELLRPPPEHADPALRVEILRQVASSLRIFGVVHVVVPFPPLMGLVLDVINVEALKYHGRRETLIYLLAVMMIGGLASLWLARRPYVAHWGRAIGA